MIMIDLTKFKVYAVGGYVRDRILRRDPKDHDYVVVGATPDDMIAAGFSQVGADFPVFLHPETKDEYALARTERKTGKGYNGFETDFNPSTTLEDDLYRRDLTINSLAREVIGWNSEGHAKLSDEIIDPFKGQRDLKKGILRHVSKAFADDPVRVLRVARFAARYGFTVHPNTNKLMTKLVDKGEIDHLVPERVWAEFEKAMGEDEPSRFFWALQDCGAYKKLFAELENSIISTGYPLKQAALLDLPVVERMVIIFSGVEFKKAAELILKLKAPSDVHRLTRKMRLLLDVVAKKEVTAKEVLDLLLEMDAFNNNNDLKPLMFTALTCNLGNTNKFSDILIAFKRAQHVSFKSLTEKQQSTLKGKDIGKAINKLRLKRIEPNWNW